MPIPTAQPELPGAHPGVQQESASRPLRIGLLCDWCLPRFGGLELQLLDLARALRAAGHAPEIITITPGEPELDGIPVHRLHGFRLPHFGVTASARPFRALRALLAEGRFDVVHVHSGVIAPFAYLGARVCVDAGVPTALTFHSIYAYLRPALSALAVIGGWRRWPVAWSAVSTRVAREAAAALGGGNVAVLPNGIDDAFWRVRHQPSPDGTLRLISVMRLQVRKRPHALISIVGLLRSRLPAGMPVLLRIVGDGPQRSALERAARRITPPMRVEFTGRRTREEIRELFGDSDMFVLPTVYESFGIAALEARAAGLPVIARDGSGVTDFIRHERDGLLAPSDAGLAEGIARLVADPALHARIAGHNRDLPPPGRWEEIVSRALLEYARAREFAAATAPAE